MLHHFQTSSDSLVNLMSTLNPYSELLWSPNAARKLRPFQASLPVFPWPYLSVCRPCYRGVHANQNALGGKTLNLLFHYSCVNQSSLRCPHVLLSSPHSHPCSHITFSVFQLLVSLGTFSPHLFLYLQPLTFFLSFYSSNLLIISLYNIS